MPAVIAGVGVLASAPRPQLDRRQHLSLHYEMDWFEQERQQRQKPPMAIVGADADKKPTGIFAHWGEHEGSRPVEHGPVTFAGRSGREKAHPVAQDERLRRVEDRNGEAASRAESNSVADSERLQFANHTPGRPAFRELARPNPALQPVPARTSSGAADNNPASDPTMGT